jgi:hypothetical protein
MKTKKSFFLVIITLMITVLFVSCETDFYEVDFIHKPINDTSLTKKPISDINTLDTNSIDTTPVIPVVPKVFIPARKLSITNSKALAGFMNYGMMNLKSAKIGGHDNGNGKDKGNAYGLYKIRFKNGKHEMDTIYTTGENDSISVGNEIYVTSIMDLENDHILLKGQFKFALDTFGNFKSKHDLIVRKSDGYIVNYDDNDEEYNINYRLQNKNIRMLSNGDILINEFTDNDSRRTIKKITIGNTNTSISEFRPELNLNVSWFDVDLNDNILYTDMEDGCYQMNIYHKNNNKIEHVGLSGRQYNDSLQFITYWVNKEKEVFVLFNKFTDSKISYIFKMNVTNNSYNLDLVSTLTGETPQQYTFQLSNGSESDYNFSIGEHFTFFMAFNNDMLSWVNIQNNNVEVKTIIGQDAAHTNIINANSNNNVYLQYDNKLVRASITTGDVTDNYFEDSNYEIVSLSSSPDDVVTLGTIRTSDNANVIWEIDANGSAKIISETSNVVVTSVENIE